MWRDGNTGAYVEVEIDAQGDAWTFSGQPVNTRFEDGTDPGISYAWRNVLPFGAAPVDANLINYGSSALEPAHAAFTGAHVLYADYLADSAATDAGSATYFPVIADDPPALNRVGGGFGISLPANAGDRWGFDVAAMGDTYVIGGPGNDGAGTDAGQVRVGSFSSPGVVEFLSPEFGVDPGRLGTAVVVDGNRMVASAPFTDAGAEGAGQVFIYERVDEAAPWSLVTSISSPDPETNGGFGDSLDLFGDLLAVGESDRFGDRNEPGRVWVYALTGGDWELQGPNGGSPVNGDANGDGFGMSLAWIDETTLAVGSPYSGGDAGRVAFVSDAGASWNVADIPQPGAPLETGDLFGFALAFSPGVLSDDSLFVGAPGRDDGGLDGGAVYRYDVAAGVATWTNGFGYQAGTRVGTAIDVSGDRAVAGGYGGGTLSANILEYLPNPDFPDLSSDPFVWNGDSGVSAGIAFDGSDGPINDYVAIEGTVVAVGRPGGGGSVALFQRSGGGWSSTPSSTFEPTNRAAGDGLGLAISLDGATLAIGAPGDDGLADEFPESGAVYTARVPVTATFINVDDDFAALGGPDQLGHRCGAWRWRCRGGSLRCVSRTGSRRRCDGRHAERRRSAAHQRRPTRCHRVDDRCLRDRGPPVDRPFRSVR